MPPTAGTKQAVERGVADDHAMPQKGGGRAHLGLHLRLDLAHLLLQQPDPLGVLLLVLCRTGSALQPAPRIVRPR
jgi:hypothetical protein